MVERSLAKAEVAGSSPVSRSNFYSGRIAAIKIGRDSEGIEAAIKKQSGGLFLAAGERKPADAQREAQAAKGLSGEPRFPLQ